MRKIDLVWCTIKFYNLQGGIERYILVTQQQLESICTTLNRQGVSRAWIKRSDTQQSREIHTIDFITKQQTQVPLITKVRKCPDCRRQDRMISIKHAHSFPSTCLLIPERPTSQIIMYASSLSISPLTNVIAFRVVKSSLSQISFFMYLVI